MSGPSADTLRVRAQLALDDWFGMCRDPKRTEAQRQECRNALRIACDAYQSIGLLSKAAVAPYLAEARK